MLFFHDFQCILILFPNKMPQYEYDIFIFIFNLILIFYDLLTYRNRLI
jgi:hypothetical protein